MKKYIIFTIIFAVLIAVLSLCNNYENIYNKDVIIIDIDNDAITTKDNQGFLWTFTSNGDFTIGQHLTLIFNDQHTNTIFDDEIIDIK